MSAVPGDDHLAPGSVDPESAVQLRPDPPRVMRLSRKAVGLVATAALALVGGAFALALRPATPVSQQELYAPGGIAMSEGLARAPRDYAEVPRLGPPLPGDLGGPIIEAQERGPVAALPPPVRAAPATVPAPLRRQAALEHDAARGSRLFAADAGRPAAAGARADLALPGPASAAAPGAAVASEAARRQGFLDRAADRHTLSDERLQSPPSARLLQAGSVIPAALVTGIRSDLPGLVTAQVTQNVYDSATGRLLLIPQGARLIGDYDADVATGQRRVLLAWNRLILPDGRSISLERQPAADPAGFAGLEDRVDYHWGSVMKAALVSTLLGIGAELGSAGDGSLVRALRRGGQDTVSRAGEQIVSRELGLRPTLTISPGFPVRVMVTRDLVLDDGGER